MMMWDTYYVIIRDNVGSSHGKRGIYAPISETSHAWFSFHMDMVGRKVREMKDSNRTWGWL